MQEIAEAENVDAYFNLGDTFETQEAVKTEFHNTYFDFCKTIKKPHYIIVGNHDCPQKLNTEVNAMKAFDEIAGTHVIDKLQAVDLKGIRIHLLPYTEHADREELRKYIDNEKENILLAHIAIAGAKMNSKKRCSSGVDLSFKDYKACFFGHFHNRQQVAENAWYIGSLTQQNWNLAGCDTGFAIYDTEKDLLSFKNLGSIKHLYIENMEQLQDIKGHCVKLKVAEKFSPAVKERFVKDLRDRGALDVKLEFDHSFEKDDRIEKIEDHVNSAEFYMEAVIEASETTMDREYLLEVGLQCLQQAGDLNG